MPEYDETYVYEPGRTVTFYSQGTFNPGPSGKAETAPPAPSPRRPPDESLNDYIQSVGIWSAPVLAVGILLVGFLALWSCCICCGCGCCAKPMKCARGESCERFGVVFMLVLAVSIAGLLIWGWKLNSDINDAVGAVNSVFEVMEGWADTVTAAVAGVDDPATLVTGGLTNLSDFATTGIDDCNGGTYSFDATNIDTINTDIDGALAEMDSVELDVADLRTEVTEMKTTVNDLIEPINEQRYIYTQYVLIGLGVLCGLQALVAMCNSRCSQGAKPAQNCKCCTPLLTWLFILITFLLWTCAAVILTSTIGLADFCMTPDTPIERLADFGDTVNITCLAPSPLLTRLRPGTARSPPRRRFHDVRRAVRRGAERQ